MQNKKAQREQMMLMIEDWQSSGLSQRAYCTTNKLAYHVFHYWYGVYRSNKAEAGSFIPMRVTAAGCNEQITIIGINGIKVQIPLTEKFIGFVKQLLLS